MDEFSRVMLFSCEACAQKPEIFRCAKCGLTGPLIAQFERHLPASVKFLSETFPEWTMDPNTVVFQEKVN